MRKKFEKMIKILLILIVVIIIFILWAFFSVQYKYKSLIYSMEQVPKKPVALILGAGVFPGGVPSPILADRVYTGVELYRAGRVKKLLMTGDNSLKDYDEPTVMKDYAIKLGVPEEDIVLDYAGFRTYDSLYRARDIFSLTDIIIVTQDFHLSRSLYISNKLGVSAVGVCADRREYLYMNWNKFREFFASVKAFIEVNITKPKPFFLGKKEEVF